MKVFNRQDFINQKFYVTTRASAEYVDLYNTLRMLFIPFDDAMDNSKQDSHENLYFYVDDNGRINYTKIKPKATIHLYHRLVFIVGAVRPKVHYFHKTYPRFDTITRDLVLSKLKNGFKIPSDYFYTKGAYNDTNHIIYLYEEVFYILDKNTKDLLVYLTDHSKGDMSVAKMLFVYVQLYRRLKEVKKE